MGLIFNEEFSSRLASDITNVATSIPILMNDYDRALSSTTAGDYYYATIRSATNYEYVKIDVPNSTRANGLSVTRGQGGSSARAWKKGTIIYSSLMADMYDEFQQKGYRTYAGDPTGNVTPLRKGEKLYDTYHYAWFKSIGTANTDWKLFAGDTVEVDVGDFKGTGYDVVVKKGTLLYGWGQGNEGELCNNAAPVVESPSVFDKTGMPANWEVTDYWFAQEIGFARVTDGTLYGWGDNGGSLNNFLGDASHNGNGVEPPIVAGQYNTLDDSDTILDFVRVATASLCLTTSGAVWGCGSNSTGELGQGNQVGSLTLVRAKEDAVTFVTSAAKIFYACTSCFIVKSDGSLWGAGWNLEDELGFSGLNQTYYVDLSVSNVSKVAGSGTQACALVLKTDGTVWAAGRNANGQLGQGDTGAHAGFVQVKGVGGSGFLTGIADIGAGSGHCVAVATDGTVYAWGSGLYGVLGDDNVAAHNQTTPAVVSGETAVACFCGYFTTFLVTGALTMRSCGWNRYGDLGIGVSGDAKYGTFQDVDSI